MKDEACLEPCSIWYNLVSMERPTFIREDLVMESLGAGRRSDAFKIPGWAIKVTREVPKGHSLESFTRKLQWQYNLLEQFVGDYAVSTNFIFGRKEVK